MYEEVEIGIQRPGVSQSKVTFTVTISEDKLAAYLHVPVPARNSETLPDIEQYLASEQIQHGIADQKDILSYLTTDPPEPAPFLIAQGTAPEAGQPAEIRYYFDVHPLKIGTVDDNSGAMDFKNRGKIPQVKEGELLAEKIPSIPGTPGKDVFGKPIAAPKPDDCVLLCGKGVRRSDDRLSVYAGLNGRPVIAEDGTVCVLPDLAIEGDVGFETGHIDFDGFVAVAGVIQSGFKVKGKRLEARGVDNGEVEISGDIVVEKGIIGGQIEGGSQLQAHHVDMSEIKVAGDVIIESEVFGSTIICNGRCVVESGRIVSSHITAMMGIEAETIGSEESKPCTLTVGINSLRADNLKALESQAVSRLEERDRLQARIEELKKKSNAINEEIGQLAQEEDQAQVRLRTVKAKADEVYSRNGVQADQLEKIIAQLHIQATKLHETIESLFADDDRIHEDIGECQNDIALLSEEIERIEEEISKRKDSLDSEDGIAEVRISGTVYAGTVICGPHASLATRENLNTVLIKEIEAGPPGSDDRWKIEVTPLP